MDENMLKINSPDAVVVSTWPSAVLVSAFSVAVLTSVTDTPSVVSDTVVAGTVVPIDTTSGVVVSDAVDLGT